MTALFTMFVLGVPVLALVLFAHRIQSPRLRWIAFVVPPLLLLPLAIMPVRGPVSMVFALPLVIVIPIAAIELAVRIAQALRKRPIPHLKLRLLRPALALGVCALVTLNHRLSNDLAQKQAIRIARDIVDKSLKNGQYPQTLDGWTNTSRAFLSDDVYFDNHIRTLGIHYPIHYRAAPEGKTFTLILVHGFNMQTTIVGDSMGQLSAVYSDEESSREVLVK